MGPIVFLFLLLGCCDGFQLDPFVQSFQSHTLQPKKLIIAGAPASGKGTQCELIKERYGVVHLSTGDILREAVRANTELGQCAKRYMDEGLLVPDEVMIGVVKERLAQPDCQANGWLLDGYPRTYAQAQSLLEDGHDPDAFVLLDVPDDELVGRVTGRRTDPVTGKIYHLQFNPPNSSEVAERLVQRSDDTEEKIQVRVDAFHKNCEAVKQCFEHKLVRVDGNRGKLEVFGDICDEISKPVSSELSLQKFFTKLTQSVDVSNVMALCVIVGTFLAPVLMLTKRSGSSDVSSHASYSPPYALCAGILSTMMMVQPQNIQAALRIVPTSQQ